MQRTDRFSGTCLKKCPCLSFNLFLRLGMCKGQFYRFRTSSTICSIQGLNFIALCTPTPHYAQAHTQAHTLPPGVGGLHDGNGPRTLSMGQDTVSRNLHHACLHPLSQGLGRRAATCRRAYLQLMGTPITISPPWLWLAATKCHMSSLHIFVHNIFDHIHPHTFIAASQTFFAIGKAIYVRIACGTKEQQNVACISYFQR